MLEARPLRNAAARVEPQTGGGQCVYIKTARPRYVIPPLSWIVPFKPERTVVLDRLGAQIWQLCDGKKNVEAIVDEFAAMHRLTFHEARTAVTEYIGMLIKRGILAIALNERATGD